MQGKACSLLNRNEKLKKDKNTNWTNEMDLSSSKKDFKDKDSP